MVSVAIVSSIFGDYDVALQQPEQDHPCEWVMVTDGAIAPAPWQTIVEPRPGVHPRLAAKVAKCNPWAYTSADVTIWVDGCVEINTADFVSWCLDALGGTMLAMHHAVARCTITSEADAASGMQKYRGLPMSDQVRHYLTHGHPDVWGLWWTGLIVRDRRCPDFGPAWLAEQVRWTYEDQLSLPPVLRTMSLRPTHIPMSWPSERLHRRDHASDN